jgi:hypothetical protein
MAEFTARDKKIAILLEWIILAALIIQFVFIDNFQTFRLLKPLMNGLIQSVGLDMAFQVIWFCSLFISLVIFFWSKYLRARLWRAYPPWLGLLSYRLFSILCGSLGFIFYYFIMVLAAILPFSALVVLQGGLLSLGFCILCLFGVLTPIPEPKGK